MRELTSKYRTAETLGKGGMGKVFRGEMTGIEGFSRIVAIKMLRGLYDGHEPARARFAREAKICGTLRHRNVVSVLDFERSDAGEPFLVMEYVDGADLRMLMKCTSISIDASVYIVAEVLCALAYAHGQRVIHRDVKPHNVLISRSGDVKLTDFGLAKLREHSSRNLPAKRSTVRGTVGYIAPEMVKQDSVDHRADLFMIGVMLYELVTGQLPFGKETLNETTTRMFAGPPEEPRTLRPEVPESLNTLILRLLRMQPGERHASADEVRSALSTCADMARGAEEVATLAQAVDHSSGLAQNSRNQGSQDTKYIEGLRYHSNVRMSDNRSHGIGASGAEKKRRRFAFLAVALVLVTFSAWSIYDRVTRPRELEQTVANDGPRTEPQQSVPTTLDESPGLAEPESHSQLQVKAESSRPTANRARSRTTPNLRVAPSLIEAVADQNDSRPRKAGTFVTPDRQHHL